MTKPVSTAPGEGLEPCPFCGHHLTVTSLGCNPLVRCDTPGCWMNAQAISLPTDDPRQVAAWNARALPIGGETSADTFARAQADHWLDDMVTPSLDAKHVSLMAMARNCIRYAATLRTPDADAIRVEALEEALRKIANVRPIGGQCHANSACSVMEGIAIRALATGQTDEGGER